MMIDFQFLALFSLFPLGALALSGWALYINRDRGHRDRVACPGE